MMNFFLVLILVTVAVVSSSYHQDVSFRGTVEQDFCVEIVRGDDATTTRLLIESYGDNALRVRSIPEEGGWHFRNDLISALLPRPMLKGCTRRMLQTGESSSVIHQNLQLNIQDDGCLSFVRVSDGKVLLTEVFPHQLVPTTLATSELPFLSLNLTFHAVEGERIYGLGQHKTGQLNNKGQTFSLAPVNTEIVIPILHSSLGYAFLFNLPSFGQVSLNDRYTSWQADAVLQMDIWVATTADGPEHAVSPWLQLQQAYINATGPAPVLPEWTTGFWQSKNRYHNQSQLMDIVEGHLQRDIPLSLIVIDYFNWDPLPLGDEEMPPQCWPDPKGMVETLRNKGVQVMVSPYFHSIQEPSKYFEKAKQKGYLARNSSGVPVQEGFATAYIYDLFQPEARAFAWKAVQQGYATYDMTHWWLDCDEPCDGDVGSLVYNNGTWPASFVGAAYPQMVELMVREGDSADTTVILGRSAWAGSQRNGATVWSGDTDSNFDNLNQQVTAGLNMALSGISYWTTDIGGYCCGNITSPEFRQLFVRWVQYGAFCPLFRNHGNRAGGPDQEGGDDECGPAGSSNEIWNYGIEAEEAILSMMRIRQQLRPYLMEQYQAYSDHGIPIMRPLFVDFWKDGGAQLVEDEFLLGPSYLVAPQLVENATSREVYLPQLPNGTIWRNVFTGVVTDTSLNSLTIQEDTPLGTFPLYLKEKQIALSESVTPLSSGGKDNWSTEK